jgi:hypothetical protein
MITMSPPRPVTVPVDGARQAKTLSRREDFGFRVLIAGYARPQKQLAIN